METLEQLLKDKEYWEGQSNTLKILINSFYGFLGSTSEGFFFRDSEAAEKVTTVGQEIAKKIADEIEGFGGSVIEIDTDGVFFIPPDEVVTEEQEERFIQKVEKKLPKGYNLSHDGRYKTMISLRMKNYVTCEYDGTIKMKGASLRSRADELFGRNFIKRCVDLMIEGKIEGIAQEYKSLVDKFMNGDLDLSLIARRERITEKTLTSSAKARLRANVGDLKLGDNIWVYEKKDGTLGKIDEYAGDIDTWYYVSKLRDFADRLEPALGKETLDRLCPVMNKKSLGKKMAGQLSLFEED